MSTLKHQKIKNQSGVTLIELLVAISIFALLTVVTSGIYVAFTNGQARTRVAQALLNDAQFALEGMAREIRNNAVFFRNYPCDEVPLDDEEPPTVWGQSCIYLEHENGAIGGFGGNVEDNFLSYVVRDPVDQYWEPTGFVFFAPLQDIIINDIQFVVDPPVASGDPLEEGGQNQHPLVTIKLTVSTDTTRNVEEVTYNLQTTVSPRIYRR